MKGSSDFLTDFLKNDIEKLDGIVYNEETDAMFLDICKGICGDEVQKVDDAVYNEETEVTFLGICKTKCDVKASEPTSNREIESKIEASRRNLKEGYEKHRRGSKKTISLGFKDLPKPAG
ncbi:hypothetical protein Ancab_036958 [Ancistrocladus abbreviatus]